VGCAALGVWQNVRTAHHRHGAAMDEINFETRYFEKLAGIWQTRGNSVRVLSILHPQTDLSLITDLQSLASPSR
jgi:hypothetical protein